jgi:L-threonylcarbamoyladenylate synthase
MNREEIVQILRDGGVGVLATDTLYGLVGSALSPDAVERIYTLKLRYPDKPLIVLISEIEEVEQFGVVLSLQLMEKLAHYWPGPYSIILPTIDEEFDYLSQGKYSIAFRIPDKDDLLEILRETGPLVAPSANIEGNAPSYTIEEAKHCFRDQIDFYLDEGEKRGKPSTIICFDEDGDTIVRE